MRIIAASAIVVLGFLGAVGLAVGLSVHAVHESEQALCPAFELLTKHRERAPANPAKNPSRVQTYQWYLTALQLERKYHCAA